MRLHQQFQVFLALPLITSLAACSGEPTSTSPSRVEPYTASVGAGPSTSTVTSAATIARGPALSPSASNFEIKFMTGMIDHHQMAVMTAEMCLEKATSPELLSLCESIRSAQAAEIAKMQEWLQEWYGVSYEPMMKPGHEKTMARLASLASTEFEIAFMEMMVKHHEKALQEGRHCLDKAHHPELRALCETIISTQSAEISLMQTWLCQWYGQCESSS